MCILCPSFATGSRVLPWEVRTVELKQFLPDTLMKVKVGHIRMDWTIGLVLFLTMFLCAPSLHCFFSCSLIIDASVFQKWWSNSSIHIVIDWNCVIDKSYQQHFFKKKHFGNIPNFAHMSNSPLIFIQTGLGLDQALFVCATGGNGGTE